MTAIENPCQRCGRDLDNGTLVRTPHGTETPADRVGAVIVDVTADRRPLCICRWCAADGAEGGDA
jgi:hypothetical protein